MDRKTVIAVVLSVVVIIASMVIQSIVSPRTPPQPAQPASRQAEQPAEPAGQPPASQQPQQAEQAQPAQPAGQAQERSPAFTPVAQQGLEEETYTVETSVYKAVFSNRGGVLRSLQLKDFQNADGSHVEMVFSKGTGIYPFMIHFGDYRAPGVDDLFAAEPLLTGPGIVFSRTFDTPAGVPFTLRKTFLFKPNDYMVEVRVDIENSVNEYPELDFGGTAYTLAFGPQIGPAFEKLDRRTEYRFYEYYQDGKKRNLKVPRDGVETITSRVTWAGIVGKYFEVIAVPNATQYTITYDTRPLDDLPARSSMFLSRPVIKASKNTDVFKFYLGPKKRDILARYNDPARNGFGMADMHFEDTAATSPIIGWLANILKFFLELFYRLIPNYGVAIILLTILIKALLFPLTHKSYESTAKMQALQPKINELRERYKSNPQKLNQEIAAFYRKEGVSPLGGCLPMLLQLPIFFALYNLLSNHFDLRGAAFIPGWINDLSAPESVWNFAPVTIPIVGWHDLRVLPFIMLGTTFLQSKLTQTGNATNTNMRMMTYLMPAVFFFILYDMPSGLVLYWTMQNILTIFQQMYINNRRKLKASQEPEPPVRRRKRR